MLTHIVSPSMLFYMAVEGQTRKQGQSRQRYSPEAVILARQLPPGQCAVFFVGDVMNDIQGKNCFLLCSAPSASIKNLKYDDVFCAVNGAIIPFWMHTKAPDYWFINSCTIFGSGVAAKKTAPLIKGARCKNMVLVDACKGKCDTADFFSNPFADDFFFYTREQRCEWIEYNTGFKLSGTGGHDTPSMGAFSIAWILAAGARKITVSGMSFDDHGGHSYLPGELTPRGHLGIDRKFLDQLKKINRVKFF